MKIGPLFLRESSENCSICYAFFFFGSVTKQSLENGFGFPQLSEMPTLPAMLKIKRHFSTAAEFGNSVFFSMENLVR